MATYAIGDIQGCHDEFVALLDLIKFDPTNDRLWLTGDLVNRGPASLAVVRCIMALADRAITVLGNHDLHLLAQASLPGATARRKDTLADILAAPDRDEIITWLRQRPLFHYDQQLNFALVHAGLAPNWDLLAAAAYAREVEAALQDDAGYGNFLQAMYGDEPSLWDDTLSGKGRLRLIANYFTRMRYCERDGRLNLREKGALSPTGTGLVPWFALDSRKSHTIPIVFGHWSTLQLTPADCAKYNVFPLDTGAVWGGSLSAMRLEDRTFFSVASGVKAPFK